MQWYNLQMFEQNQWLVLYTLNVTRAAYGNAQ